MLLSICRKPLTHQGQIMNLSKEVIDVISSFLSKLEGKSVKKEIFTSTSELELQVGKSAYLQDAKKQWWITSCVEDFFLQEIDGKEVGVIVTMNSAYPVVIMP